MAMQSGNHCVKKERSNSSVFRRRVLRVLCLLVSGGAFVLASCAVSFVTCIGDDGTPTVVPITHSCFGGLIAIVRGGQVVLAWENPSSPAARAILSWENIKDSSDGGTRQFSPITPSTTITYIVENLNDATTYTFTLTVVDAEGNNVIMPLTTTIAT